MCTSLSLSTPASPAFSSYHWARALARARRKVMMALMAADPNGRMTRMTCNCKCKPLCFSRDVGLFENI